MTLPHEMTKPKQVRIYMHGEDGTYVETMATKLCIAETTLLTMIVSAGLRALRANQDRFELPLSLRVGVPEVACVRGRSVTPAAPKK